MPNDLLLTSEAIFTGLVDAPQPGAILVRDGVIVAVGTQDEVAPLAAPNHERVDAGDGLISASFQDAHVHPVLAGLQLISCNLGQADTAEGYLAIVAAHAEAHPDEPWIVGGGWAMPAFPGGTPTRQLLDAIVPDRPVYLINRDAHGAWVNTAALELAGIDAATPDPVDGVIEREPDGFPAGTLQEGATQLVSVHLPPTEPATVYRALLVAQERLLALGITAWQDAIIGSYLGQPDNTDAYLTAVAEQTLRARVIGALWWQRDAGAEQIPDLVRRREQLTGGRFRATSVKMMLDGVAENFTASMVQPYLDRCGHSSGRSGVDFVDPRELPGYVTQLDRLGFQVHFHALGDGAVRSALDALHSAAASNNAAAENNAGENGPAEKSRRHHLAHLQVVHPDDIARFAEVDATANLQALWAAHDQQVDELVIPFLGPERDAMQYPFRSLRDAGTRLAAGSDWPVSDPNPIAAIHVAVNRTHLGGDEPAFHPEQSLTLAEAWLAYTAGSAYVNGIDDVTGTIEVGKRADLIVLDSNPFAAETDRIGDARVLRTYLDGEAVFQAVP
ncbi:amidohydrolase [soil metagenome]